MLTKNKNYLQYNVINNKMSENKENNEEEEEIKIKIMLLGESQIGKTSFIQRYVKNNFNLSYITTVGIDFQLKQIKMNNKSIKLQIWDTAGQEKYRSLTKFFYKDAAIAVLVYDITRRDSFDEVKKYWYEQLKTCGEKNLVIGLAGNKCDMFDKEAVTEDEAKAFAKEIGAQFQLTSAFKNNGINELFKLVGSKYLDPNFQEGLLETAGEEKKQNIVITREEQKKKDKERKRRKDGCC